MKIIYHQDYILHEHRGPHPERPQRLEAIMDRLESEGLTEDLLIPEKASEEVLYSVHSEDHITSMKEHGPGYIDGGDTYLGLDTYDIARSAAGGALKAVDMAKKGLPSMALLRPPGHHAGSTYGGGFCYFNNIAIAAVCSGKKKVAIIDLDGHHGNGTSDIFYKSKEVLFISAHHYGIYPGTGDGIALGDDAGEGYNVNIPFRTGTGDISYEYAWDELIEPLLSQYGPDIILVSLGTDGHYADGMTGLSLSSSGYINMSRLILDKAEELCGNKVAFFLEGGYHLGSLSEIIAGIVSLPEGIKVDIKWDENYDQRCLGRETVDQAKVLLDDHWDLCL